MLTVVAQEAEKLIPIEKDGKWGYCDVRKTMHIEPAYDFAWPFVNGTGIVLKDGMQGCIDREGNVVLKPKFKRVKPFQEDRALAMLDGLWFVIDRSGKKRSKGYRYIYDNKEYNGDVGLLKVYGDPSASTAAFGWINWDGEEIVPANYPLLYPFSEGFSAAMSPDSLWGFLDAKGNTVIEHTYSAVHSFSGGLAQAAEGKNKRYCKFIYPDGTLASDSTFYFRAKWPPVFSEGLAIARIHGGWAYVNQQAEIVIDGRFSDAKPFTDGWAIVKRRSKYGIVDKEGNEILPLEHRLIMPFSEDLAAIAKEEDGFKAMGYINRKAELVIPYQFKYSPASMKEHMFDFVDGRAVVVYDTGKGVIDADGNELVSPNFTKILPYRDGLAIVKEQQKWGVLDLQGKHTTPLHYTKVTREQPGPPLVWRKEKVGMVNLHGKEFLAPEYDSIKWMGQNLLLVEDKTNNVRFYVDTAGRIYR